MSSYSISQDHHLMIHKHPSHYYFNLILFIFLSPLGSFYFFLINQVHVFPYILHIIGIRLNLFRILLFPQIHLTLFLIRNLVSLILLLFFLLFFLDFLSYFVSLIYSLLVINPFIPIVFPFFVKGDYYVLNLLLC